MNAFIHINFKSDEFQLPFDMKFEVSRQFYIRLPAAAVNDIALPSVLVNVVKRKGDIECQTLDLMKLNQKVSVISWLGLEPLNGTSDHRLRD